MCSWRWRARQKGEYTSRRDLGYPSKLAQSYCTSAHRCSCMARSARQKWCCHRFHPLTGSTNWDFLRCKRRAFRGHSPSHRCRHSCPEPIPPHAACAAPRASTRSRKSCVWPRNRAGHSVASHHRSRRLRQVVVPRAEGRIGASWRNILEQSA